MGTIAVLLPALLLAALFIGYCLRDLARAERVRWIPKWAWGILCVISVPLGGMLYLLLAKPPDRPDSDG